MNYSPLEKSILATLAYFDIFDYPLYEQEIWRWLYRDEAQGILIEQKINETDFSSALKNLLQQKVIEQNNGFYFLPGRVNLVSIRAERQEENKKKWRRALSGMEFLRLVPFLKLVAVCNTLAINNAKPASDIDFFIVASSRRIFTCRAFVTWLIGMLGLRRHGAKIQNRICLSFYITEDHLNLEDILLKPRDPHLAFWLDQFVPLYDRQNTLDKLQKENQWVKQYLPHAFTVRQTDKILPLNPSISMIQGFFEMAFSTVIGEWMEHYSAKLQRRPMAKKQSISQFPDTRVVIGDDILKFHEEDRREEYRDKFYKKLQALGLT